MGLQSKELETPKMNRWREIKEFLCAGKLQSRQTTAGSWTGSKAWSLSCSAAAGLIGELCDIETERRGHARGALRTWDLELPTKFKLGGKPIVF